MTSSTPVSPLYPFNNTNPPPRKRQRGEGNEVSKELSDVEPEELIYSPAGDSDDEHVEAKEDEFEELFDDAGMPVDVDHKKQEDASFECSPCSGERISQDAQLTNQALGGGYRAALHQPPAVQELVSSMRKSEGRGGATSSRGECRGRRGSGSRASCGNGLQRSE